MNKSNFSRVVAMVSLLFLTMQINAQNVVREFHFNKIGWSVAIPYDFIIIDSASENKLTNKGVTAMESTLGEKLDISKLINLFTATKNGYNYISATIEPYSGNQNEWLLNNQFVKNTLTQTFMEKMKDATVDTSSSMEYIDNLRFEKFLVIITINSKVLFHSVVYSRLYKGYDFGITYLYTDDKIGEVIKSVVKDSKFDK